MSSGNLPLNKWRIEVKRLNRAQNGGKLYCVECGKHKSFTEKELVCDHIDNDNTNNTIENGQILCKPHNRKKNNNPSRIITYLRTNKLTLPVHIRTHSKREHIIIGTEAMRRNVEGKPAVMDWLKKKLSKTPAILVDDDFWNSAAKVGNVLVSTVKTWIEPECSSEGDYRIKPFTKKAKDEKGREIVVTVEFIMTKASAFDFDNDKKCR